MLPVKREGGQDHRPVQDLRLVTQATVTLHPTVPNPYTLLSLLLPRTKVYSCLDLKDAFFCIAVPQYHSPPLPLNGKIQSGAPNNSSSGPPPQEFKNSPAIFGEALASDLDSFHPEEYGCWLLQYGNDLLLAAEKNAGKGEKHCSSC